MSWVAWNWRLVLVLLSSKPVEWKITYVEHLAYNPGWQSHLHYYLGPLLTALFLLLIYPLPSIAVYRAWAWYQKAFIRIEQDLRSQKLVPREEMESWERRTAEDYKSMEDRISRRDVQISTQKNELEASAAQIEALKSELTDLTASNARLSHIAQAKNNVPAALSTQAQVLLRKPFLLVFNPSMPPNKGTKRMRFGEGGEIIEGKNKNEHSWRLNVDGNLEFLNDKNVVHNRFFFHPASERFIALEKSDLPAIPGQILSPIT